MKNTTFLIAIVGIAVLLGWFYTLPPPAETRTSPSSAKLTIAATPKPIVRELIDGIPVSSASFAEVWDQLGCDSSLSYDALDKAFDRLYKGQWMTWSGEVGYGSESRRVSVIVLPTTTLSDIDVDLAEGQTSANLQPHQPITIRFILRKLGSCVFSFKGDHGVIVSVGDAPRPQRGPNLPQGAQDVVTQPVDDSDRCGHPGDLQKYGADGCASLNSYAKHSYKYMDLAAQQGSVLSRQQLANLYWFDHDWLNAYTWFEISARTEAFCITRDGLATRSVTGHANNKGSINSRNDAATHLLPAEADKAQANAIAWLMAHRQVDCDDRIPPVTETMPKTDR